MLLLQKFHGYQLLIPNQYHQSTCLRSFATLEKCFYLEAHPLYYQKAFRNFTIYSKPEYYELRMRGCLVLKADLAVIDHWLYIEADNDNSQTISQLLVDYIPKRSPVRRLVEGRSNDFFSLMPLQCIHQFLVGISFREFKEQINRLTRVTSLTYLSSAPIVNSHQLSGYYAGFRLNADCQQFLLNQQVYFYEELELFDWWLLAKLPYMCEKKVAEMQGLFYEKTGFELVLSS